MNNDKEYTKAIKQANKNIKDIKKRGSEAIGTNALNFMDKLLTLEEINKSNSRVTIIGEQIKEKQ